MLLKSASRQWNKKKMIMNSIGNCSATWHGHHGDSVKAVAIVNFCPIAYANTLVNKIRSSINKLSVAFLPCSSR